MGLRFDALLIPANGRTVEQVCRHVYGDEVHIDPTGEAANDGCVVAWLPRGRLIVSPAAGSSSEHEVFAMATAYSVKTAHVAIFDEALADACIMGDESLDEGHAFMVFENVCGYGFATFIEGEAVRRRVGSFSDETGLGEINIDEGDLNENERTALCGVLMRLSGRPVDSASALAMWADAEREFSWKEKAVSQHEIGQDVVERMIAGLLGLELPGDFSEGLVFSALETGAFVVSQQDHS